jgi:hypothetical protein
MSAHPPTNRPKGGSLGWAWRVIDDYRANDRAVPAHKLEVATDAIFNVTGYKAGPGVTYTDETALRRRK